MLRGGTFSVSIRPMDRVKGGKKGTISTSEKDINPVAVTHKTVKTLSPAASRCAILPVLANGAEASSIAPDRAAPAEGDGCVMGQFLTG